MSAIIHNSLCNTHLGAHSINRNDCPLQIQVLEQLINSTYLVGFSVDVKLCEATSLMDNKLKNERLAIERKLLIPCIVLS